MAMKICMECGSKIDEQMQACPNCGYVLKETVICHECGKKIRADVDYCPNCGAPTRPQKIEVTPGKPAGIPAESGAIAVCAMVFAFLLPPVGLIFALIGLKKNRQPVHRKLCIAALVISVIVGVFDAYVLAKLIPFINNTVDTVNKGNKIKEFLSELF